MSKLTHRDRAAESFHAVEGVQGALNKLRELHESWNQRLTLENLALAKRYLEGELRVLAFFRSIAGFSDSKEFCAIFQRELPVRGFQGEGERSPASRERLSEIDSEVSVCGPDQCRTLVFLRNTALIEPPEDVSLPSSVRFARLNYGGNVRRDSLYFSRADGWKFICLRESGETTAPVKFGSVSVSDEVTNQMVERGAQIMEDFANDDSESERNFLAYLKGTNPIAGLRLTISNDTIWVQREESFDLSFEIVDLLFGPFNLRLNAG